MIDPTDTQTLDMFTLSPTDFLVKLLHNTYGHLDKADMVNKFCDTTDASDDVDLWLTLMNEEAIEVREALLHLLKEITDLHYVYFGLTTYTPFDVRDADALLIGALNLGERVSNMFTADELHKAFERVHQSNMSKLQPDGTALKREDGKIIKGPHYAPPDLSGII
jgi:hypothetical protein